MRIGFVISNLCVGGSEFYAVELANKLIKRHSVTIYVLGKLEKKLVDRCDENIKLVSGEAILPASARWLYHLLLRFRKAAFLLFLPYYRIPTGGLDVAHCFDSESCVVALQSKENIKVTTGLYHKNEFSWPSRSEYKNEITKVISAIPLGNCYVDSSDKIRYVKNTFLGEGSHASIFPFAAPEIKSLGKWVPALTKKRILVPSRLRDFKSYIETVILMAAELSDYEYEVWIVGSGPLEKKLRSSGRGYENVHFVPEMSLEKLAIVMLSSRLVVATGTTSIIAASIGVPTIVGVESDPNDTDGGSTHGYFFEAKPLRYFYDENIKQKSLRRYILDHIGLANDELTKVSSAHVESALRFDMRNHVTNFELFLNAAEIIEKKEHKLSIKSVFSMILKDLLCLDKSTRRRYAS